MCLSVLVHNCRKFHHLRKEISYSVLNEYDIINPPILSFVSELLICMYTGFNCCKTIFLIFISLKTDFI